VTFTSLYFIHSNNVRNTYSTGNSCRCTYIILCLQYNVQLKTEIVVAVIVGINGISVVVVAEVWCSGSHNNNRTLIINDGVIKSLRRSAGRLNQVPISICYRHNVVIDNCTGMFEGALVVRAADKRAD